MKGNCIEDPKATNNTNQLSLPVINSKDELKKI